MQSCEYKPQIPLTNYIIWFIKHIWRGAGFDPYRDCVTLIARELNIADKCLIYSMITGKEWFYGKNIELENGKMNERLVFEMLRDGIIMPSLKSNIRTENIPYDITNKDAIEWICNEMETYEFIIWATKCLHAAYNNMYPLEYLVAHCDLGICDYMQLMSCIVKMDHVKACMRVHANIPAHVNVKKISVCRRPNTFAFMRDLGYSFNDSDPKGYLMCIPVDEIPNDEMSNIVTWAMACRRTKWLDVIHASVCITEMLALCEWYHPAGLQWFLAHGVRIDQLNMSIIGVDDFKFLAPLCDDHERAEMMALGDSNIVRAAVESIGTIQEYTWDRVWFMRRASYARMHLMQKLLCK